MVVNTANPITAIAQIYSLEYRHTFWGMTGADKEEKKAHGGYRQAFEN